MKVTTVDAVSRVSMRPIHRIFRDSIRQTGNNLGAICIQAKVSRDQLAALLRGADHCTLGTLTRVAERLSLSVRIDPPPPAALNRQANAVPSVVDLALRRLGNELG